NSSAPRGGPTNSRDTTCAAYRRLLASSSWSRRTIDGMIAWAALSKRVSPVPSAKATTHRTAMLATSAATVTARVTITTARTTSTVPIIQRRSTRSTNAPLTRLRTSQGRRPARLTAATSAGSRVMAAASNGSATSRMPSPRVETPAATQMRQKRAPSADLTGGSVLLVAADLPFELTCGVELEAALPALQHEPDDHAHCGDPRRPEDVAVEELEHGVDRPPEHVAELAEQQDRADRARNVEDAEDEGTHAGRPSERTHQRAGEEEDHRVGRPGEDA